MEASIFSPPIILCIIFCLTALIILILLGIFVNSFLQRYSGVSKAYLYNHSDVRERIETLRRQQEGLLSPKQVKQEMTDTSKNVLISAKNKRIKMLEDENL
jgi:hypothetical protein